MARTRARRAIAVVAALVLLAAVAWIGAQPQRLIQIDKTRQRISAGLARSALTVDDHRWVYAHAKARAGDAPLLVFVHGFTGSKENWYPLVHALGGAFEVVVPDLPGWGDTQRRAGSDYGYTAQARRVAAFIQALPQRRGRSVVLVGHSMGGGIAALVAAQRPDLVAWVALIDAGGVRFADNAFGRAVLDGDNPFAVRDAASLQAYIATVFHDRTHAPWIPWPADRIYIAQRRRDAAFEQGVLDRIGRGPERFLPGEAAARIGQPALLLWCRQDRVIDASALALYAARIPQARRVLLDGCGHMAMMEKPHAVAAALDSLINEGAHR